MNAASLEDLFRDDRSPELSPADYVRLAREVKQATDARLESVRTGFLSSFTLGFVEPYFVVEAARRGWRTDAYFGGFGQFEQEVLEGSRLREFAPDALVIALRPEDVDPDAVVRYAASGGRRYVELVAELVERLYRLVAAFRGWSQAPVLVANFTPPARLPFGVLDANHDGALSYAVAAANAALRSRMAGVAGVAIWDYASLVRARGSDGWTDPRLWAMARIAVAARHQPALAAHLVRTLRAVRSRPAKCLVLDLDNTLWGGVVGDEGLEGIALGDDYPGNVYKSFQRAVLALRDRGILLALASRNDADIVDRVFRDHPEMLIRWEHVAAARIAWHAKSRSLREIAAELNIGVDSLVLFDDNPAERAEVRANAPEVGVIEVPADPLGFEQALADSGDFDQISLSEEDFRRGELYRVEGERRAFAAGVESVTDFLTGLDMVAEFGTADAATLGRVAQLINKTNQFNLTTRRRTLAEVEALCRDPSHRVVWLRVRDRFGDQGIVAVAIVRLEQGAAVIDTLLMSCRMMNRQVEDALVAYLLEQTREAGRDVLYGEYVPTPRNRVVADFYTRFGFEPVGEPADGARRFALDLAQRDVAWPGVIARLQPS